MNNPPKLTGKAKKEEEGYIKPKAVKVDCEGKEKKESRHVERKEKKQRTMDLGFKKGGKVKETGKALVHKGEVVLPKDLVNKMMKLMK